MQAAFLQGATRVTKKLEMSKVQRPSGAQSMEQGWPLMLPRMPPRSAAGWAGRRRQGGREAGVGACSRAGWLGRGGGWLEWGGRPPAGRAGSDCKRVGRRHSGLPACMHVSAPGQSRLHEQEVVAQSTLLLLPLKPHSVALQVIGLSVLPVRARWTSQYWSAAAQYTAATRRDGAGWGRMGQDGAGDSHHTWG